MIANCYGGSNVLHMLILHSKCSINVPTSCVRPGTCRNIWNVPNLLSAGKWQVLSTRACNVLNMFSLVSRPPRPQCMNPIIEHFDIWFAVIGLRVFHFDTSVPLVRTTTGAMLSTITTSMTSVAVGSRARSSRATTSSTSLRSPWTTSVSGSAGTAGTL